MTSQAPEPSTNKLKATLASLWVRVPVAVAIGLGAAWITGWQYGHLSPDPAVQGGPPPSLPYACPIAGDCKLPGDDRRKGDKPQSEVSSSGSDRIMPPDDKPEAKP